MNVAYVAMQDAEGPMVGREARPTKHQEFQEEGVIVREEL